MFKKFLNIFNGGSSASRPDSSSASLVDEGTTLLVSPKLTGTALLFHSLNRRALEMFQDTVHDLDYEQKSELYETVCESIRDVLSEKPLPCKSGSMETNEHTGRSLRQKTIDEFMEDMDKLGNFNRKNRTIH